MPQCLTVFRVIACLLFTWMLAACGGNEELPQSPKPKLFKSISPFENPESVIFDKKRNVFYVSQANFSQEKGGGKIALVNSQGQILEDAWIDGLNHPKGLGIDGDKLYVADVIELVEIDIKEGRILKKHALNGALFLNDVAVSERGTVFVSDTLTNKIAFLQPGGKLKIWLEDEALNHPNGLFLKDGMLYVASWGAINGTTVEALLKAKPNGGLLKINLSSQRIYKVSDKGFGNLDGLVIDQAGHFYVTDWVAGKLFHLTSGGRLIEAFDIAAMMDVKSAKGLADLYYDAEKNQILAPMMLKGSVDIFSLGSGSN